MVSLEKRLNKYPNSPQMLNGPVDEGAPAGD